MNRSLLISTSAVVGLTSLLATKSVDAFGFNSAQSASGLLNKPAAPAATSPAAQTSANSTSTASKSYTGKKCLNSFPGGGYVQVKVTMKGKVVTAAGVINSLYGDTRGGAGPQVDQMLSGHLVSTNKANVVVTRATMTSKAWNCSANDAMSKA